MMAGEPFGFAAYRSRQQTTALESALKRQGIPCRIINTPHEIGMGCGLSVRFELNDLKAVKAVCDRLSQNALIGIYHAEYVDGRLVCRPATRAMRHCH
jgi:hypothetical protein